LHHLDAVRGIKEEGKEMCFIGWGRGRSVSAHSESGYQDPRSRRAEPLSESEDSEGGIGSQSRENRSQALKRRIYPNHGRARSKSLHPSYLLLRTPKKEPNAKQRQNI
ncbi:hypothetical protein Tco_1059581, partial [Tanacetum coccineum]